MTLHFILLLKRRPDMTREQFSEYWNTNHARIFMSFKAVKDHIVRYNQFHVLSPAADMIASAGFSVPAFDGAAEFWVDSMEDMLAFIGSEDFKTLGAADEEKFMDRTATQILVGEDRLKWVKP
ncbi:hypothetical protein NM688_g887 [Phlebia brevispora]|uniref:Uncharacterized protein n=1 Tax=Phlebia brevispora TaxID=194682 RepID=A0ACC1TD69_9APHY|nr:hypothetical protein NM688_g887 [Phlebia brevispora]